MKALIIFSTFIFLFIVNQTIAIEYITDKTITRGVEISVPDTLLDSGNVTVTHNNDTVSEKAKEELIDDAFADIESDLEELENPGKSNGDTTKIRIGSMKLEIVDDGEDVIINKEDNNDCGDWDDDWTWDDDGDFKFHKRNKDKFKPHWAGISLGLNNFLTADGSNNLPSDGDPNMQLLAVNTNNSMEFNLNIAQFGVNILKNRIGLVSGVGFKWNNYKFRNTNTVLVSDSTPLYYYEAPSGSNKFSKLTTCYLIIPLLLEFQLPTQGKPVYLSGGVEGGIKLGAWTKIKSTSDQKLKDKSDFHTVPWDYRLTARLGYGNFGVFGTYGMLSVFEKDKGPELHPITIGASLNF